MKHRIIVCVISVFLILLLASCATGFAGTSATATTIELEMTSAYDAADPFVSAKLFTVSEDADSVEFGASLKARCDSALLEIADNETKAVIWDQAWTDGADEGFAISLRNLEKEKEYVIQLTCTGVENVSLVMTTDSGLVEERARPRKTSPDSLLTRFFPHN